MLLKRNFSLRNYEIQFACVLSKMESSDESENENVDYRRDKDVYIDEDWEDIDSKEEGTEEVGISSCMYEPTQTQNNMLTLL